MNVGERIRKLREEAGYSQNELAGIAGISQTHLRRVELGQSGITVDHLQMVCDALNVKMSAFFDEGAENDEFSMAVANLTPKQKGLLLDFLKNI